MPKANTAHDKTRELQTKLYRAAKRSPTRRFHALWDRIHRRDVLERAWREVRANRGAPGVDAQTIDEIEESGAAALLDELQRELREQRYRPLPVRRVAIPKPGGGERPIGVPAVRDRVVQAAAVIVLSPIFEADCAPRGADSPGEVKGLARRLSQQATRSWGQPGPGGAGPGGSSPYNVAEARHRQTRRPRKQGGKG